MPLFKPLYMNLMPFSFSGLSVKFDVFAAKFAQPIYSKDFPLLCRQMSCEKSSYSIQNGNNSTTSSPWAINFPHWPPYVHDIPKRPLSTTKQLRKI